ncbi:MAG: Flagellar biosynthetic protein FlhB [Chlamydiae bacterium]|nr:Flagellar biosynthetic protein FlhB [Chlamydiota bacterium]
MNQERSERPTKKKLRDAKKKGQVAKSQELCAIIVLLGGIFLIFGFAHTLNLRLKNVMIGRFTSLGDQAIESQMSQAFSSLLLPTIAIMIGIMGVGVAIHLLQGGWIWKRPKRSKGGQFVYRLCYSTLKLGVVGALGYLILKGWRWYVGETIFMAMAQKQNVLFKKSFSLAIEIGVVLLFLALIDFGYQKWRFYQKMKMTKQEVREEKRETDGDPAVKHEIRNRMREKD